MQQTLWIPLVVPPSNIENNPVVSTDGEKKTPLTPLRAQSPTAEKISEPIAIIHSHMENVPTQNRPIRAKICPDALKESYSKLRPVMEVQPPDLDHIKVKRVPGTASLKLALDPQSQSIDPHLLGLLKNYEFTDFYTDVRRCLATLCTPVQNQDGSWRQSKGHHLVTDINTNVEMRALENFLRNMQGQPLLPDNSVSIALGREMSTAAVDYQASLVEGRGSASIICFDPTVRLFDEWNDIPEESSTPPEIVLGHELIHARANQMGEQNPVRETEEYMTVGLIKSQRLVTENDLRTEHGHPLRTSYGGMRPMASPLSTLTKRVGAENEHEDENFRSKKSRVLE